MTNPTSMQSLYDRFLELAEAGDENAIKQFLKEHLSEFPEETKKQIFFAFFEDELSKKADIINANLEVQKEGFDLIQEIEKTESALQDEKKKIELRSKMAE